MVCTRISSSNVKFIISHVLSTTRPYYSLYLDISRSFAVSSYQERCWSIKKDWETFQTTNKTGKIFHLIYEQEVGRELIIMLIKIHTGVMYDVWPRNFSDLSFLRWSTVIEPVTEERGLWRSVWYQVFLWSLTFTLSIIVLAILKRMLSGLRYWRGEIIRQREANFLSRDQNIRNNGSWNWGK